MNRRHGEVDYSVVDEGSFRGISGAMHNVDMMITSKVPNRKMIVSVHLDDIVEVNDLISLQGFAIDLKADEKILVSKENIDEQCRALCDELRIHIIMCKDRSQILEKINIIH